jgi:predicted P-loop ATPase
MSNGNGAASAANDGARASEIARHMETVARRLLGEPNKHLSTKDELRFGTHGSLSVDLEKGTFYDHEAGEGGGVLDLIAREKGGRNGEALDWLRDELDIVLDDRPPATGSKQGSKITARYVYHDERGEPLYRVLRWEPKRFSQERCENGAWIGGKGALDNVRRVLFGLPELLAADPAEPVFVCEGEKDVDRLRGLGLVATTNPQGAGKWLKVDRAALKGRHVVVLPDNDDPGRKHAEQIKHDLTGKAASVHVLELPDLPPKGDVSDWLDAGGTVEELRRLATEPVDEGWEGKLHRHPKSGEARDIICNVVLILRHEPVFAARLRWNELKEAVEAGDLPWRPGGWAAWTEADDLELTNWCQGQGVYVRKTICAGAVQIVARDVRHHPVREYLSKLVWDGKPRLDTWLRDYLDVGAEDVGKEAAGDEKAAADPRATYHRKVGRAFLISAVARVYEPGCKVDHTLILEGAQGRLKSTTAVVLAVEPDWFTDEIADLGTKDSAQDLRGKWLVEIAELSAMKRAEVERIKAFISRKVDHYRPSYGQRSEDFPRQCVFIGSTNADAYLADETGGRRFWPVRIGKIDIERLRRDRDQLWAEAVAAYKAGEKWWLDEEAENLARAEQEDRRQQDPWERPVLDWAADKGDVPIADVLDKALEIPRGLQDQSAQNRVARILKAHKWERFKKRVGGSFEWRYRRACASRSGNNGPEVGTSGNGKAAETPAVPSVPSVPTTKGVTHEHQHGDVHTRTFPVELYETGGNTGNSGNRPSADDGWRDFETMEGRR